MFLETVGGKTKETGVKNCRISTFAAPHINNCSRELSHFVASNSAPQL